MTRALAKPSVRLGLLHLLVVIVVGAGLGAYAQAASFSYADLLAALRSRSATVQQSSAASSSVMFQGTAHQLTVNGAQVAVYEYGTTLASQLDAGRVSSDGSTFHNGFGPFGGQVVTVDYVAPPHHFRRGRVIVSYIGSDVAIIQQLTAVLGPQFAGGAVPNGIGYLWLLDRLRATGATIALIDHHPGQAPIGGIGPATDGYDVRVNGVGVSVFEFTQRGPASPSA